jgi:uncharacterized protein (TIGR01777 family)
MRVVVTGASGLIGTRLTAALRARGDEVVALSRSSSRGIAWDPVVAPAPAEALAGADAVVNLAGEPVGQRWTSEVKRRIRDSRVIGTANLVGGLRNAETRARVLVSSSAAGYYGDRGDEVIDETTAPGSDFLAGVCVEWEREASVAAEELGMRVVLVRTGVVLDAAGGALKTMVPPFRLGVGGPVGSGRQYMPWIALDDVVGIYLAAIDDDSWSGPVNASAPAPATNREFSRALGRALHRPAVVPVPVFALRARYGEMATVVTDSARMVPARALELGYRFRYGDLDTALRAALAA